MSLSDAFETDSTSSLTETTPSNRGSEGPPIEPPDVVIRPERIEITHPLNIERIFFEYGPEGVMRQNVHRGVSDRTFVLNLVTNNGMLLRFVPHEFRDDKDIVLVAVANCGLALQHASNRLRGDREVILAAVTGDNRDEESYLTFNED